MHNNILHDYAQYGGYNLDELTNDYFNASEDERLDLMSHMQEVMQQGGVPQEQGQEEQIMQIIEAFAQVTGNKPEEIIAQLQKVPEQQQQQMLQQMVQTIQKAQNPQGQQNPQEEQTEQYQGQLEEALEAQLGYDAESLMGYRDDSPFRNRKKNLIKSPFIDMNNTGQRLVGISDTGDTKIMEPYSGQYQFHGNQVLEIPYGQTSIKVDSLNNIKKELYFLNSKKNLTTPEKNRVKELGSLLSNYEGNYTDLVKNNGLYYDRSSDLRAFIPNEQSGYKKINGENVLLDELGKPIKDTYIDRATGEFKKNTGLTDWKLDFDTPYNKRAGKYFKDPSLIKEHPGKFALDLLDASTALGNMVTTGRFEPGRDYNRRTNPNSTGVSGFVHDLKDPLLLPEETIKLGYQAAKYVGQSVKKIAPHIVQAAIKTGKYVVDKAGKLVDILKEIPLEKLVQNKMIISKGIQSMQDDNERGFDNYNTSNSNKEYNEQVNTSTKNTQNNNNSIINKSNKKSNVDLGPTPTIAFLKDFKSDNKPDARAIIGGKEVNLTKQKNGTYSSDNGLNYGWDPIKRKFINTNVSATTNNTPQVVNTNTPKVTGNNRISNAIKKEQEFLKAHGYPDIKVDGILGPKTLAARNAYHAGVRPAGTKSNFLLPDVVDDGTNTYGTYDAPNTVNISDAKRDEMLGINNKPLNEGVLDGNFQRDKVNNLTNPTYGFKTGRLFNSLMNNYKLSKAFEPISLPYMPSVDYRAVDAPFIDPRPYIQNVRDQFYATTANINSNSTTGQAALANLAAKQSASEQDILNQISAKNQAIDYQNRQQRANLYNQIFNQRNSVNSNYTNQLQQTIANSDYIKNSALSDYQTLQNQYTAEDNAYDKTLAFTDHLSDASNIFDKVLGNKKYRYDKVGAQADIEKQNKLIQQAYEAGMKAAYTA